MTTPTPVATGPAVQVLTGLLAAEHAAIYAYGVLGARLDDATRVLALRAFDALRIDRDEVHALLVDAGANPPTPLPAYDVVAADRAAALALAIRVEVDLEVRWHDLVVVSADPLLRTRGSSGLQAAAVRAAVWRKHAGIQPRSEPFPGLVSPSPTPTSTPS